jgi:hypothetical protein
MRLGVGGLRGNGYNTLAVASEEVEQELAAMAG